MSTLGLQKITRLKFDDAIVRVTQALKAEGFGVLTDIDIKSTLKAKIGVEFRRYRILGACNPTLAHEALNTELEVGLMLPCNVIVYENDSGKTVVTAVDPTRTMAASGSEALLKLAATVKDKLNNVIQALESP